jgi:SpoIIAA-like
VLSLIEDLPQGVVGVEAQGVVSAGDYEAVLVPALEAAIANSPDGKASVLYVAGHEFPDYTVGALWQDTKFGFGHMRAWRRIAIVTDADWLHKAVHALAWLIPGEAHVFPTEDVHAARAWVIG